MTSRSPLGFGPSLCILAAYLSLFMNLTWGNPGLWLASSTLLLGLALRGRWNFDRRMAAGLLLVPLGLAWLMPTKMALQTHYLSPGTFRLAVAMCSYVGLLWMWRYRQIDQRVAVCLAVVSQLLALVSMERAWTAWPVLLQVLGLALAHREEHLGRPFRGAELKEALKRSTLPMMLMTAISVAGVMVFQWSDTKVNFLMSLINISPRGSLRFADRASLTGMWHGSGNPAVVARYYSERPSLYLVSRCYRRYQGGAWELGEEGPKDLVDGKAIEQQYRYDLQSDQGATPTPEKIEVTEPSPGLMFPRDAAYCLTTEPSLRRTFGSCWAYGRGTSENPFEFVRTTHEPTEFGSETREQLLEIDPELKFQLRQIASQWVSDEQSKDATPEQLAHRWENYLQNRYDYGFDFKPEDQVDPVITFLRKKPASHCELFGTAMVLMCRAHNIPARYVNGFLAKEYNESGGYTVIRVKHAHAWVEAYFAGKGWVTLDGTPSIARQFPNDVATRFQHFTDLIHTFLAKVGSQDWQLAWKLGQRLLRPFFLPLFGLWLLYQVLVRRRRKKGPAKLKATRGQARLPYQASQAEALLARLEERWSAAERARPRHQTLQQWSLQLGPASGQFLQLYSRLRYGASQIGADDFRQLSSSLDQALAEADIEVGRTQPR